jgi:peroxidase
MTSLLTSFRPIGGAGNNLVNPTFDPAPGTPELNIAPADFGPGRTPLAGPNARTISNVVSGNADPPNDPKLSGWLYVMGQFIDHDLDLENPGGGPINITVPNGDPVLPDGTTIPLNRALANATTGTVTNTIAGYLDLSQVYGSDAANAASLRNADGTMKTSAGDALPIVGGVFVAGDVRVMENPELSAITTMFVREHNFQVARLHAENPTWTGDQLYNMAKAITTAEYQNIIYSEYLPVLIGNATRDYHGYNPTVNAQVTQEFSTSAFRVGHSQISDIQAGIDNNGNPVFSQSLADSFFNTPADDVANGIDALLRNLSSDTAQATDVYAINDLRNLLVAPPDAIDLIAIDVQRERDVGIGTLNETRIALGLKAYTSFAQLTSDPVVQVHLQTIFGTIGKVDLFIGGLAEKHVGGGVVGQTFQAIIANQFNRLETGDRFFWKNQNFDAATKKTISQTTLGDIIERTTGTPTEQQNVFLNAARHTSDVAAEDPNAAQLIIGVDTPGAHISGGPADDTIVAGLGLNQVLTGGGGRNVFVYNGGGHVDHITRFHVTGRGDDGHDDDDVRHADDQIQFQGVFANANITVHDLPHNAGVQVIFGGNTITLDNIHNSHQLSASDFILPPGMTPIVIHT